MDEMYKLINLLIGFAGNEALQKFVENGDDDTLARLIENGGNVIVTDWDKVNTIILDMLNKNDEYATKDNITVWNTKNDVHIRIEK